MFQEIMPSIVNCVTHHTCGFIKNKVVETSIEKATLIPHTHDINDSNKTGHAWMVRRQQHPNMTYKVPLPFTKYACCTCELALRGNLCKHQVVILLTCTNFIKENIIQYCGIWYGFDHGGFVAMFVDLTYLHIYDNEFDDEKANEDHYEEPWVVDMWGLVTLDGTSPIAEQKKDHNQPSSSSTPNEKTFVPMGDIMQRIINEIKEGGVQLINHTTSLLCVIAIDVRSISLPKVNEIMHFDFIFHCVNDGFGNSVHQMKD
jgi:hypothetical protein